MATNIYTIAQWLAEAVATLLQNGITDSPQLDSQLIACEVLQVGRTRLYAFPETTIEASSLQTLNDCLARRASGEPIAYICGHREFWSMHLTVKPGTLVPRADTEILVEQAIACSHKAPLGPILDLGTGTGAIAIALATELPQRHILALEQSADAIAVAQINIENHAPGKVSLIQGSWLSCLNDNSIGLIVSNPPYLGVADSHLATLAHEPIEALVSGSTGMEDLAHIIEHSVRVGKKGAPLLLEHGFEQGTAVRQLFLEHKYSHVHTVQDLAGLDRVTYGITAS